MKGGIAGRLAIIFSLLVLVATATVGFLVFWGARQSLISASQDRLQHTAETVEVRLSASLEAIGEDVLYLAATPPVPGIVRAYSGPQIPEGRYDRLTNHTLAEWADQLAESFAVFLENRPSYLELRLIGRAEGGREIVRVERTDTSVYRVPNEALQQRGEEAYFIEAINLAPGQVYFSEITLADESNGVAPGIPTLLVATPVFDAGGQPFGVLIVNVDFRPVLRTLPALVEEGVSLYLANGEGDFLIHPDSTQLVAENLDERNRIQDEFPEIESYFTTAVDELDLTPSTIEAGPNVSSFFGLLSFDGGSEDRELVLVATAPWATILAPVTKVRNRSALITVLFALWGIALALVFSSYLTRPLRQITRAVAGFGRDDNETLDLPVKRKDEIGVLARTFDTMAHQIQMQIEELEDKARRQRIILETSAESIIVTDESGVIETFNRAAERMFGYQADEVLGQNVNRLVFSNDPVQRQNGQWQRLGHGHEVTGRRKDGSMFALSLALSSFDLAGEKKYAGFLQDITKRKEYEQTLREAKLTAEAANRAKSAFLANMSHEIRTPLTGIIGFASLLAKQVSGKHRKYAQLIEGSGERLKETLNSVLDLAKLEANRVEVQLEPLVVAEEGQAVVQLFQAQAQQKGLALEFRAEEGAERARAPLDRGGFSSILHNLVGNAIKFTEEGSITVGVKANAETVRVYVRDTGVGIEASFLPHLFDEFRQESSGFSRTHEGSGLGLAITQRLVQLMDGTITVESKKGKGSTFTVAFPRAQVHRVAPRRETLKPATLLSGLSKTRLLLVEDNENTQYLIENMLEDDFNVTVVSNAEEALLKAFNMDFDVVLLDINLGEGPNGADVLRELRAMPAYNDVPIVAVTAYALPGDRERFLEMGFTDYLAKPFNADELLALAARL